MDKAKVWRIIAVLLCSLLGIAFVFLLLPRLLILFLPFVLAYLLAKIIEPLVAFLESRAKIPRTIGSIFGIVLAIGVLGTIVGFLLNRLWTECNEIVRQSDVIIAKITGQLEEMRSALAGRIGLSDTWGQVFSDVGTSLTKTIADYTMPAIRGAFSFVKGVPSGIIFAVVFFIGAYFMSSDSEAIRAGLRKTMPAKITLFMEGMMKNVFSALVAYIRAQLVMICVTFLELTLGFLIIGGAVADYALVLALVISIIDAIPILGTGTVLIPWGVYALLIGDIRLGIMLIVLYLICLAVRQIMEPRLVARQIGLHPLLILMVMYIGLRAMGIFGMIIGPVLALVVKQLHAGGVFAAIGQYINGKE